MSIRATALQIEPEFGNVESNVDRLVAAVRDNEGTDLLVAPELVNTGYDLEGFAEHGVQLAESASGPTVQTLAELAKEVGCTLVVGFLEAGDDGLLYDSVAIVSAKGIEIYRKTHLYPPESARFGAGDRLVTTSVQKDMTLGTMICFEHAFPEIATTLALAGANVFAIPSAVPRGYEHLMELRSRARAQDNQVFVVSSNLAGGEFFGGSIIVDPRGNVLAQAGEGEEAISADLDLDLIAEERRKEPALRLRRPDLYV